MSNVPSATKAKADAARALQARLNAASQGAPATATAAAPAASPPVTTGTTDVGVVTPVTPSAQSPAVASVPPEMDWEKRYKGLRASRDARIHELETKLQVSEAELERLKGEVESLRTAAPSTKEFKIDAEQRQFLGDEAADFLEEQQRRSAETIAALTEKVNNLTSASVAPAQSAAPVTNANSVLENQFYADLDRLAPKWREVNNNKHFHAYLAQIDARTDEPRQKDLVAAQDEFNAEGVAFYVNDWLRTQPQVSNAVEPDLGRHGGDFTHPGAMQQEGMELIYSPQEVKDFYNRLTAVRNRKAAGRNVEAELNALLAEETDIKLAVAERRVRDY